MIDVSTYLDRTTSEHKTRPYFMALVEARLKPFADLCECLETFDAAFDLDTAVGKQLDVIGEYVGVPRLLNFQPVSIDSALLTDSFYRLLIKARISLNNWDGTTANVKQIWQDLFPEYDIDVIDNQDMSILIHVTGLGSLFENEVIQHGYINPKPMGVLINYTAEFRLDLHARVYAVGLQVRREEQSVLGFRPPPDREEMIMGIGYISGRPIRTELKRSLRAAE
ncbi:MAG: DUF2612 domain-containing protein [Lacrimispora sphenoides]